MADLHVPVGSYKPTADAVAKDEFCEWFAYNYPRDTIIHDPLWHAPKIFRRAVFMYERGLDAAMAELERLTKERDEARELLEILKRADETSRHRRTRASTVRLALRYRERLEAAESQARVCRQDVEISANRATAAEQRVAELEGALRELVRVMEIDEPRFNEWHDAIAGAEKLLGVKDG